MTTKSLITCWIKNCDYPLYRRWIERYYKFFDEIIIYWSDHFRHMYYDEFIEKSLQHIPNVKFLPFKPYKYGEEDWRNIATNRMLEVAKGEWIISIEQDFFTKDWDKLLNAVNTASTNFEILGYKGRDKQQEYQEYLKGEYVHPAFFFIKRSLLEKTSMDFGAKPSEGYDHFGRITRDIIKMGVPIWWTQDNGFPEEDTFHQGGVNFNYLESQKEGFVFYHPEVFYVYNWWSMKADVSQDPKFMELMKKVDMQLKEKFTDINPETSPLRVFYQ